MATTVKITTVGNSLGIVLPKEVLSHMNVQKGDMVTLTKTRGGIQLVPYQENFVAQLDAARTIMRENREVLKKLAE
jgi:putative addiction module antidote